jgi:hypothetical protein
MGQQPQKQGASTGKPTGPAGPTQTPGAKPSWSNGAKDNDDPMQQPLQNAPAAPATPPLPSANVVNPQTPPAPPVTPLSTPANPSPMLALLMSRAMGQAPPQGVNGNIPQPSAMPGQPVGV